MGKFESRLAKLEKSLQVDFAVGDIYSCVEFLRPRLQSVARQTDDPQRLTAVQELLRKARDKSARFSDLTDAGLGLLKELLDEVHEESIRKTR